MADLTPALCSTEKDHSNQSVAEICCSMAEAALLNTPQLVMSQLLFCLWQLAEHSCLRAGQNCVTLEQNCEWNLPLCAVRRLCKQERLFRCVVLSLDKHIMCVCVFSPQENPRWSELLPGAMWCYSERRQRCSGALELASETVSVRVQQNWDPPRGLWAAPEGAGGATLLYSSISLIHQTTVISLSRKHWVLRNLFE